MSSLYLILFTHIVLQYNSVVYCMYVCTIVYLLLLFSVFVVINFMYPHYSLTY